MADRPATAIDLNWEGGFKFTSSDAYGHTVTVDAPMRNGEGFDGMKPGELLLTSLAACSAIDVVNILQKQRQQVSGVEIRVTDRQLPDPPWTWVEIELEYTIRGKGLKEPVVEQAIDLSENKYCSVGATIAGKCKVTSKFAIVEA